MSRASVWTIVLLLLGGSLAGCAETPEAFAARCAATAPAARIVVTTTPVAFATDQARDSAALAALVPAPTPGQPTLGLTHATLHHSVQLQTRGLRAHGSTQLCVRPQVDVALAFSPMTVYLARDLQHQPCLRREVWQHEMGHVRIYEEHLAAAAHRLQERLRDHFGQQVFVFRDAEELQQQLDDAVTTFLEPLVAAEIQAVQAAQVAYDSPTEYLRLAQACPSGS